MRPSLTSIVLAAWCIGALGLTPNLAADELADVRAVVTQAAGPVMERFGIPGMAVGVAVGGESRVFNYGTDSKTGRERIENGTLFEIGSVSKTFTATLAAYAEAEERLSFADPVSKFLPALRGSAFDQVSLQHLATHTAGGMPLQMPDEVTNDDRLTRYFQHWKPACAPGTTRTYSNLSIGLLGRVVAASMDGSFAALMEGKLFPALGLKDTFVNLPASANARYAQGYTEDDKPSRLKLGVLGLETYGVRTTAADLLRFVEANMDPSAFDEKWRRAINRTHTGYYRVGPMTQDLIWEQYPYPVTRENLLAGNSTEVILKPNPAVPLDPPLPPRDDVLINKTGSTNGFSTYVAFVPARKVGVVMLANKRFPIEARVALVHEILTRLDAPGR